MCSSSSIAIVLHRSHSPWPAIFTTLFKIFSSCTETMGLLKDAITSAMGPSDVKNGLSGPQLPFANGRRQQSLSPNNMQYQPTVSLRPMSPQSSNMRTQYGQGMDRPSISSHSRPRSGYDRRYRRSQEVNYRPSNNPPDSKPQSGHRLRDSGLRDNEYSQPIRSHGYDDPDGCLNGVPSIDPPPYGTDDQDRVGTREFSCEHLDSYSDRSAARQFPEQHRSNYNTFRPIVLPTVAYGDGQPFLRGYSYDLERYDISKSAFISIIDAINVAITPNPELQIFQKGASIAGWFV